ncbi:hypothetical protein GTR02_03930 [Kineococcus sp. R8]|uniref:hypothetical protein n=1 Tax=Kineococcus siccus TaxID=2696567 RepID=UPI001412F20E|nr:hypothetical protein [Kineococcus siccus]NAZ80963.1 hypothetical protein [Kineococcus siccus]
MPTDPDDDFVTRLRHHTGAPVDAEALVQEATRKVARRQLLRHARQEVGVVIAGARLIVVEVFWLLMTAG